MVVGLNEMLITLKNPDTTSELTAPLYAINSTNTTEVRIQSTSTAEGNEHIAQYSNAQSFVATNVPSGIFQFSAATKNIKQAEVPGMFLILTLVGGFN